MIWGYPYFWKHPYQSLPYWELTYYPFQRSMMFLFPFGGICDQKALKLQVDYVLNAFFSVKTLVLVRAYNQQFQGTILLVFFAFQGIRKDFGASHFLFQQKGRKQTPSPQESCKTITGLRISEWTRTQTKKSEGPCFSWLVLLDLQFSPVFEILSFSGWDTCAVVLFFLKVWLSWLPFCWDIMGVMACILVPISTKIWNPRGFSLQKFFVHACTSPRIAILLLLQVSFRYEMWPTLWTHIFRYLKWRNPEPYGYFGGWVYPIPPHTVLQSSNLRTQFCFSLGVLNHCEAHQFEMQSPPVWKDKMDGWKWWFPTISYMERLYIIQFDSQAFINWWRFQVPDICTYTHIILYCFLLYYIIFFLLYYIILFFIIFYYFILYCFILYNITLYYIILYYILYYIIIIII